jgi:peptidoglycan/LPS O-acetylase OafA/YrhL
MGTVGEWVGVLFIGTIFGILLAVRVPLNRDSQGPKPSKKIWAGCSLTSLATGMSYAFGMRALRSPLILVFLPVAVAGMFLYAMPITRAKQSSRPRWILRWLLAGVGMILFVTFGSQSLQRPIVFFTAPVLGGCMLIDWLGSRIKAA